MKYFLFFFLTPLLLTYSQTDSLFLDDFKSFVTIGADFYISPLGFDSEDWIKFSATIGITGIATLADKDIKNFSQRNHSNLANSFFSADKYYYTEFVGVSIIGFYAYGFIDYNSKVRKLAVKLTEATFLASTIS